MSKRLAYEGEAEDGPKSKKIRFNFFTPSCQGLHLRSPSGFPPPPPRPHLHLASPPSHHLLQHIQTFLHPIFLPPHIPNNPPTCLPLPKTPPSLPPKTFRLPTSPSSLPLKTPLPLASLPLPITPSAFLHLHLRYMLLQILTSCAPNWLVCRIAHLSLQARNPVNSRGSSSPSLPNAPYSPALAIPSRFKITFCSHKPSSILIFRLPRLNSEAAMGYPEGNGLLSTISQVSLKRNFDLHK